MKIFYFGSIISNDVMDTIVIKSKIKPSNSPVNFQYLLIKGLFFAHNELTIRTLPPIKTYPNGCMLLWKAKKEKLDFGIEIKWLATLNLNFCKQISVSINAFLSLLFWLLINVKDNNKIIISYYIYPPYSLSVIILSKIFKCKNCTIITDLPKLTYDKDNCLHLNNLSNLTNLLLKFLQNKFDSYILLTKHMVSELKIEKKPYIVVEGFSDKNLFSNLENEKSTAKTIMYAGALNYNYGIKSLLKAFVLLNGNFQLWLYGSGNCTDLITEYLKIDERIKYFGKKKRIVVLQAELKAHLLVILKKTSDLNSNFSFSSKIIEYMTSGTPILCTRVGGIPEEYFDFIFSLAKDNYIYLKKNIETIFLLEESKRKEAGLRGKRFVLENKNFRIKGVEITRFLKFVCF
jgi:glycosyltransferase involved in cell wall biosynthesis